jgi:hypothetical protein
MKQHRLQHNEPFLQLGHTREGKPFVLTGTDFERHKLISGITGSGKSFLIASLMLFLFSLGFTVILIDPNGDLTKLIITLLAGSDYFSDPRAYEKLYYIDFKRAEQDAAIAFNVLNQPYEAHTVANNLLEAMHRAFPSSTTTANLDNVLLAASLVLIENKVSIVELPRLILDSRFREQLLTNVSDRMVVEFFRSKFGEKVNANLIDSAMRRSFLLTFSPVLRNTLGQKENKLNFRHILDTGISCVFNLGGLDDQSKRLLGGALLVNIEQAFLSRANIPPELRKPAHIFVDEFPAFSTHSEQSFTNILEQVRKYKGTLYLAHQTQSQLSSGMAGSLQNAISIVMKAGYSDSSTLVQHFYRPKPEKQGGFFDPLLEVFGLKEKPEKSVFDDMEKKDQARSLFETLNRQEALVTLNGTTTLIKTNTIPPVSVSPSRLKDIEDTYARRLLTPLSRIAKEQSASNLVVSSAPVSAAPHGTLAKRRVPRSSSPITACETYVGAPGTEQEVHGLFSLYGGYLTVAQVARILQKSENTARNKLKRMLSAGLLETQSLPRTSPSGKTPLVYSLKKGARKHEFLAHALATSEILITSALLPTVARDFTIVDLQADATLKASPIKLADGYTLVPDGKVLLASQNYEYALYYEVDRNSERGMDKIIAKLNNYITLARQCSCLTVAFCVTEGGDLRVKTLKNWAQEVLPDEYKDLFLFAAVDLETLSPERFFLSPTWSVLAAVKPVALLER